MEKNRKELYKDISVSSNKINQIRKKEIISGYKAINKNDGSAFIDIRVYQSRSKDSSSVYAISRIQNDCFFHVGTGSTNGGGYNLTNAAVGSSLLEAGVPSDVCSIADSHGVEAAMKEICKDFSVDCFIVDFYA